LLGIARDKRRMLHLVQQPEPHPAPQPAPEPVLRLAILRKALLAVDEFGGGPAPDFDVDQLSANWAEVSEAERRCVDRRSEALMAVASAGLKVVSTHRQMGEEVSPAALQLLADEIRAGVADIEQLIRD
jgi:hypothetical protein